MILLPIFASLSCVRVLQDVESELEQSQTREAHLPEVESDLESTLGHIDVVVARQRLVLLRKQHAQIADIVRRKLRRNVALHVHFNECN